MKLPLLLTVLCCGMLHSQTFTLASSTDTLRYTVPISANGYLQLQAAEANLAYSWENKGVRGEVIDLARGIGTVEEIALPAGRTEASTLLIWVSGYRSQQQAVSVRVTPSKRPVLVKQKLTLSEYRADLKQFETIRRQYNSGSTVYRSNAELDSIYAWAGSWLTASTTVLEFYELLNILTNFEGSCHNGTRLPVPPHRYVGEDGIYFPYGLVDLDGVIRQDIPREAIPLGCEIISINGVAIGAIQQRLASYYYADGYATDYAKKLAVATGIFEKYVAAYGGSKCYKVVYKDLMGDLAEIEVKGITHSEVATVLQKRYSKEFLKQYGQERYGYQEVAPGMYHLYVRGFDFAGDPTDAAYQDFERMLQELVGKLHQNPSARLIVDVRGNGGGAGALYVLMYRYLAKHPFRDSRYAFSNFRNVPSPSDVYLESMYVQQGLGKVTDFDTVLEKWFTKSIAGKCYLEDTMNPTIFPADVTYTGPMVLLVDEQVASAGSHLASLLQSYNDVYVIGRETSGGYYVHNGHAPITYILNHTGIMTTFSLVHVVQDAAIRDDQPWGRGIMPDLEVPFGVVDYIQHRDVWMEAALEYLQQK